MAPTRRRPRPCSPRLDTSPCQVPKRSCWQARDRLGNEIARLLSAEGCRVRLASRRLARAEEVCRAIGERGGAKAELQAVETATPEQTASALAGATLVFAAGAAGVELLTAQQRAVAGDLQVAIDLNAVPPLGIGGIEATDCGEDREGVIGYGALGVGALKMKIHKSAIRSLFESNQRILDAEEIFEQGKSLLEPPGQG